MNPDPKNAANLKLDITELDQLIDAILLASRIEALGALQTTENVDLLALAAEECARYDCELRGGPVTVRGDSRLLRHMIRNLLENAERHGKRPVSVGLRRASDWIVLEVTDAEPGIPPAQRERVFAPFASAAIQQASGSACRWFARSHACMAATRSPEASLTRRAAYGHAAACPFGMKGLPARIWRHLPMRPRHDRSRASWNRHTAS